MLLLLMTIYLLSDFVVGDGNGGSEFNCPNGGVPKADAISGKPVQCLPGRETTSATACGHGYACFFSGFNYRCCPTSNDDDNDDQNPTADDSNNSCPGDSLIVLDANGIPLSCDENSKNSNGCTGYCFGGTICCERFKSQDDQMDVTTAERNVEQSKSIHSSNKQKKIVIESENAAEPSEKKFDMKFQQIETENELLDRSTTQQTQQEEQYSTIVAVTEEEEQHVNGNNQNAAAYDDDVIPSGIMSIMSMSKNQRKMDHDNNTKIKQFLLKQIRRGWPYNEEFYRTGGASEDTIVLRNRQRPTAILHFPN